MSKNTSHLTPHTSHLISNIISVVFHPLLMPTVLFLLLSYGAPYTLSFRSMDLKFLLLQSFLIFSFIFPALFLYAFFKLKLIKTLTMKEREERPLPFAFITFWYLGVTYLLYLIMEKAFLDKRLIVMMCSITLSLALITIISLFWKISAHSWAISGVLGILIAISAQTHDKDLLVWCVLVSVFVGAVMSARLQLNAHSQKELYVGAGAGFLVNFGCMYFI